MWVLEWLDWKKVRVCVALPFAMLKAEGRKYFMWNLAGGGGLFEMFERYSI